MTARRFRGGTQSWQPARLPTELARPRASASRKLPDVLVDEFPQGLNPDFRYD
jgi:hypothetical protein